MIIKSESKSFGIRDDNGGLVVKYSCNEIQFYRAVTYVEFCLIGSIIADKLNKDDGIEQANMPQSVLDGIEERKKENDNKNI